MGKWVIIIVLILIICWWVFWYYTKNNVKPISSQIDLKSQTANLEWIISTRSYCDTTLWSCQNRSSSSSSSSSSWGWWWWGGK